MTICLDCAKKNKWEPRSDRFSVWRDICCQCLKLKSCCADRDFAKPELTNNVVPFKKPED